MIVEVSKLKQFECEMNVVQVRKSYFKAIIFSYTFCTCTEEQYEIQTNTNDIMYNAYEYKYEQSRTQMTYEE